MRKALLTEKGQIVQVADAVFDVHPAMRWVDVPDDTTTRDAYVDGMVVKPVVVPPPRKLPLAEIIKKVLIAKGVIAEKDIADAAANGSGATDRHP